MHRTPPPEVRRTLAREVKFGCPVEGCGSLYLTWHHFDPPYRVREHHDPAGMIALCREHHDKADAGAFTPEQLRGLKKAGRTGALHARFDWMRHDLLAVVGGNFYFETLNVVATSQAPVVWLRRDPEVGLLLNVKMLTVSGRQRIVIRDNWWLMMGEEEATIECPPHGRLVRATYPNGDRLKVEFRDLPDAEAFDRRYPSPVPTWEIGCSRRPAIPRVPLRSPESQVTRDAAPCEPSARVDRITTAAAKRPGRGPTPCGSNEGRLRRTVRHSTPPVGSLA